MKKPAIKASAMDHRITIQQAILTYDEIAGKQENWQDIATVWAQIIPLNGGELLEQRRLSGRDSFRVTIRYRNDVDIMKRLKLGSRLFDILHVKDIEERHHSLQLLVEEKTP